MAGSHNKQGKHRKKERGGGKGSRAKFKKTNGGGVTSKRGSS